MINLVFQTKAEFEEFVGLGPPDPRIDAILAAITALGAKIDALGQKEDSILATLQEDFADLQAKVTAEETVQQGAITLLGGLKAQLDALAASSADVATVQAGIQALSAQVATDTQAMADAVAANTPAAPAPAPAPAA